jgi:hypothetical protein
VAGGRQEMTASMALGGGYEKGQGVTRDDATERE